MPGNKKMRRVKRRSTAHTLIHEAVVTISSLTGEAKLTAGALGIDTSRIARIRKIVVVTSMQRSVGSVYSYTIENMVSAADAVNRSATHMISPTPRAVVLHAPRGTDFAYISDDTVVTVIEVKNAATSPPMNSTYQVRVTMEYKPRQVPPPKFLTFGEVADALSDISGASGFQEL